MDDMVDGLIKLMETENAHEPVNLGSPQEVTILDLAQKIIRLSGSTSKIVHLPMPENEINKKKTRHHPGRTFNGMGSPNWPGNRLEPGNRGF